MTVHNIVGFEAGAAIETNGLNGTCSIQTTIKRTGAYALRVNPVTTATGYCDLRRHDAGFQASINTATEYYRFYFYIATLPASNNEEFAVIIGGSGNKLYLRVTS